MKKAYVIGKNASKSLSPTIFNYWFNKYNIEGEYGFKEISENTEVSINTALGRMRYALINLRKIIQENKIILLD